MVPVLSINNFRKRLGVIEAENFEVVVEDYNNDIAATTKRAQDGQSVENSSKIHRKVVQIPSLLNSTDIVSRILIIQKKTKVKKQSPEED